MVCVQRRLALKNLMDQQELGYAKDALQELPEKEALVIQLYYVEELNVFEIAEGIGGFVTASQKLKNQLLTPIYAA